MSDELFPPEQVAVDSPRLKWIKARKVSQHFAAHCPEPYSAWIGDLEEAFENDELATGDTETAALLNLAAKLGIPDWRQL